MSQSFLPVHFLTLLHSWRSPSHSSPHPHSSVHPTTMPALPTPPTHPPLALQISLQQAGLVPAAGRKLLTAAPHHMAAAAGNGKGMKGKGNSSSLRYLRNATKIKGSKAAPSPASTSDTASSYFSPPAETAAASSLMPDAALVYNPGQDQVLLDQLIAAAQSMNG